MAAADERTSSRRAVSQPAQPAVAGGLEPTIQYEEAAAHADDRIVFEPGGRVTVPFTPRADDGWTIAGSTPRPLPVGRATGRQMVAAPRGSESTPTAVKGLRREVFGFLPYWQLADDSTRLDYDLLSTIAYFSVGVARDGTLVKRNPDGTVTTGWAGWTSSRLTGVINAAHTKGTRVVLTLTMFAWTTGQAQAQATFLDDAGARKRLARQAAAAVRDRGADGINLDFEPLVEGREDEFVALVQAIRAELDAISPGYQLTFDALGRIGNYPVAEATAPGAADAVFIMGYDYRTSGSPIAGSISPLAGPAYDLADTVLAYLDEVPAAKIILGVPWYGRAWSTVSDELNARTQTGPKYGASASVRYGQAIEVAATRDLRWDDREQAAWFAYRRSNCTKTYGCVTSWRQVYYDDDRSLRLKYDLVNRSGLRGVGIWALGYEGTRRELSTALADKFLRDTTPPEAGISVLPAEQVDEGFLVDWVARDDYNGVTSFDVEVSVDGGPWTPWLTGTTAGADVWLGRDGRGYAFRARAKDGKGNLGTWDTATVYVDDPALAVGGFARVLVDGLSARAEPATSAKRRDTLSAGTIVAITDGPVTAGGYTWYEVIEPIVQWSPVSRVRSGVWVAASGGGSTFLAPVGPPNSTRVTAGISGLSFNGAGAESVGPTPAAASWRAFSPNGDGSQDTLRLDWQARVDVDSLTLNVFRPDGTLLGSQPVEARAAGERSFDWDGRVGGALLPDGTYLLQLVGVDGTVSYAAPSARPVTPGQLAAYAVTIDTVAPAPGMASISGRRISPDGDGRLDTLVVAGSAKGATRWVFTVSPMVDGAAGAPVGTAAGAGGKAKITWDGTVDGGAIVPDGAYRLTLRNLDWAGNGPAATWDVVVDARDPVVVATATPAAISPNGDGVDERMSIGWTSDERVAGWIRILRGKTLVRRWPQARGTDGAVAWDGKDTNGRAVPDGRYAVELELTDVSGNRVVQRQVAVVDRTAAQLRWRPTAFLPGDGDELAASASLSFRLTRTATTSLRIEDSAGQAIRTVWKERKRGPGTVAWTWDGRDGQKAFVPPGRYVAVLTVASPFGVTELRRAIVLDAFVVSASATELAAGDTLTLTFRSVEPLRAAPMATFIQTGLDPVKVRATKTPKGAYTVSLPVAAGSGPASIVIVARDARGGRNATRLVVTVR